jgi:site-specific recombinase XerD
MAGMRDYTDAELDLVRKSFSGRYALRDHCFFEMALQMGLRVSEMLSLTVGQVFIYGKVVDEVSIERKHMKKGVIHTATDDRCARQAASSRRQSRP